MDFILALLTSPEAWATFAALAALEVVLGVDNVIFISIIANKLPPHLRPRARYIGLSGALVMRIILLFSITWIMGLTTPLWSSGDFNLTWKGVILILGGAFLIYKAVKEIKAELSGEGHDSSLGGAAAMAFGAVIAQIMMIDLVFSLDSIITAVGLTSHLERSMSLPIMIAAVTLAIAVMMVSAGPIADFIDRNPTMKMLALAFLVMVGLVLVIEGLEIHFDRKIMYAAMVFSVAVEVLNLLRRRKHDQLDAQHRAAQGSAAEGSAPSAH